MKALIVIFCIAAVLVLIGFVPVGADAELADGAFLLALKIGFLRFRLGGGEEKKTKKPRAAKKEDPKPKKKKPNIDLISAAAKAAFPALLRLVKSFRVQRLVIRFTAASADPADAAMLYASAGTLLDILDSEAAGKVRVKDIRANVDFDSATPDLALGICMVVSIGRIVTEALRIGKTLILFIIRQKYQN